MQPAPPPRPKIVKRHKPSAEVARILHKLDWSAERGEWSAYFRPEECELLARIVRDYYERLNTKP